MDRWLKKRIIESEEDLRVQFEKGKPFKHLVLKNFFDDQLLRELASVLEEEHFGLRNSDRASLWQTDDLIGSENGFVNEFYQMFISEEFVSFIERITGIRIARGAIEMNALAFDSTQHYLCYSDFVAGRTVAFFVDLGEGFSSKDGGQILLYDCELGEPVNSFKEISPNWNNLILTEVSPTSFKEIRENVGSRKRFLIGGWFH